MSFEKPFREDPARSVDRTAALSKIPFRERASLPVFYPNRGSRRAKMSFSDQTLMCSDYVLDSANECERLERQAVLDGLERQLRHLPKYSRDRARPTVTACGTGRAPATKIRHSLVLFRNYSIFVLLTPRRRRSYVGYRGNLTARRLSRPVGRGAA